jgi:hypothetical protein
MDNMNVYFVQGGKIVKKGFTNDDGTFVIEGLKEGAYSFAATGSLGFTTFGVNVVKGNSDKATYLEAAAISPNATAAREIISANLPDDIAKAIIAESKQAHNDLPSEFIGTNRIQLTEEGLKGRVVSLASVELSAGLKAHILQGKKRIAVADINPKGEFVVKDFEAGVYDLVIAGADGVAAVSFEAVSAVDKGASEAYTSIQDTYGSMDVALAAPSDYGVGGSTSDAIVYDSGSIDYAGDCVGCGVAAGGSCGSCGDYSGYSSCCGGGGGGTGCFGGRWGRLALLAGAAVAIALGASGGDDDGGGGPMTPSEP